MFMEKVVFEKNCGGGIGNFLGKLSRVVWGRGKERRYDR